MSTAARLSPKARGAAGEGPKFVFHPSFEGADAEALYDGAPAAMDDRLGYMTDDVTRDATRRMHYAAWRARGSATPREKGYWLRRYYDCRDRAVVGNLKLTYRAVNKWRSDARFADDLTGECQLVLVQAVAAYNPWLGIRFTTYAFTCLMRALSRQSQRLAADRLAHSVPLEALPDGEPPDSAAAQPDDSSGGELDEYLQEGHTLLTPREKMVLIRRYCLRGVVAQPRTLEQVGREVGLSKERVRQVQESAMGKLRRAMLAASRS